MTEPIQASSQGASEWRSPFVIAMLVYYLAMVAVGLWVPDDIFKNNPGAREFSDFMAGIVPQIDRITALNIKPDVNRFYFSVLWAGSPVVIAIMLGVGIVQTVSREKIEFKFSPARIAVSWALSVAMCFWVLSMVFVDPENRLSSFLFGTKVGRAAFAHLTFTSGPVFLLSVLLLLFPWYLLRNFKSLFATRKKV